MKITKDGQGKYVVDLAGTEIIIYDKEVAGLNFALNLFNLDVVSKVYNGQWNFVEEK